MATESSTEKWEQNEPSHYRNHEMMCAAGEIRCFHTIVTVENGEVVAAEAEEWRIALYGDEIGENQPDLPIIEPVEVDYLEGLLGGLQIDRRFRGIEHWLNSALLEESPIRVEYDSHYGYPKVIVYHFCEFVGVNPITGFCEPNNSIDSIIEFEVLSDE